MSRFGKESYESITVLVQRINPKSFDFMLISDEETANAWRNAPRSVISYISDESFASIFNFPAELRIEFASWWLRKNNL